MVPKSGEIGIRVTMGKDNTIDPSLDGIALRGRELDQLCRFSGMLGTTLDAETLIDDSLESLLAMSKANRITIALSEGDAKVLAQIASRNWDGSLGPKGIPAPAISSLGTEAVAFEGEADLPPQLKGKINEIEGPLAVVPLWAHARLRGVAILSRANDPFGPSTLKLLTAAGRQLALAVENSHLLADLQQSYRKLMDAQEELIRAERLAALGQLSATLAHEIRNPLATIFSAISQIRKHSSADGVTPTLLDIAEEEASRLNRMVTGLLDFARPRKPAFEPGDLKGMVEETIRQYLDNNEVPEGVTLALDPQSEPIEMAFDLDLIHRALVSLISNGIQSLEERDGRVIVKVSVAQPGEMALVSITDDGCGMARDVRSKACDPFFSTKPSGTGLGLPTARRIAEDHRGTLEIDTEPGRGTTIGMLLSMNCERETPKETAR